MYGGRQEVCPPSDLADPRIVGNFSPTGANPLELLREQRANSNDCGVLLPTTRLRCSDNRGVDTGNAHREAQRRRDGLPDQLFALLIALGSINDVESGVDGVVLESCGGSR